jgi:DNA-binding Lrp family transcriptional regulator
VVIIKGEESMAKMSQMDRIVKVLAQNNATPGIAPRVIAKKARVPVTTVYKRVSDLRRRGTSIYTNFRNVAGQREMFYRLAD